MSASLRRVVYRWERSTEVAPGTVRVTFAEPMPLTEHGRLPRAVGALRRSLAGQAALVVVALASGVLGLLLGRWL